MIHANLLGDFRSVTSGQSTFAEMQENNRPAEMANAE
jgi:hypothetical protein